LSVSQSITNWTTSYDLLRFRCEPNFDYPLNTKYIWLYLYNPITCLTETWYRYDIDEHVNSYENTYQVFYNSNKNLKLELSQFLKYLYIAQLQNYILKFQCASYCDAKNTNSFLFANSYNLTIIKYDCDPTTIPTYKPTTHPTTTLTPHPPRPFHPDNTAALVGGILGGILGFVLLLGLLTLLLCCCCKRRRAAAASAVPVTTNIENTHVTKSSTLIYPVPFHSISTVNLNAWDTSNCYETNLNHLSGANVHTVRSVASCRSRAPEHYLNILTIHRDADNCCDEVVSGVPCELPIHNEINHSRRCLTNEECHQQQHQSSSYQHNYQQQDGYYVHGYQQQQPEFSPRYC
jgi:hypothetical protein